jgi:DNA processing protein
MEKPHYEKELRYEIALTLIPQIGHIIAKNLLEHFGSASAIFNAGKRALAAIEDVGYVRAEAIKSFKDFARVEQELRFMEQYKVTPLFYTSAQYPQRLKQCADSPVMLYYKGNADLNAPRIVSVVGTRNPSEYGRQCCADIVAGLAAEGALIISGMAYGIDITAHEEAVSKGAATAAVLAHGLDRLYPSAHGPVAKRMLEKGGLITEFMSDTQPDKQNFPRRNRIIAGLADVTLVIESGLKGGSLITADIANSYSRDVMAIPGRVGDPQSEGCLELIRTNRAMLVTCANEILDVMGWASKRVVAPLQRKLFPELNAEEQHVLGWFNGEGKRLDEISSLSQLPGSKVAQVIAKLQMQHLLVNGPGGRYHCAV